MTTSPLPPPPSLPPRAQGRNTESAQQPHIQRGTAESGSRNRPSSVRETADPFSFPPQLGRHADLHTCWVDKIKSLTFFSAAIRPVLSPCRSSSACSRRFVSSSSSFFSCWARRLSPDQDSQSDVGKGELPILRPDESPAGISRPTLPEQSPNPTERRHHAHTLLLIQPTYSRRRRPQTEA